MMKLSYPALKISLLYLIVATVWILFSDAALNAIVENPDQIAFLQTVKGWAFVLFTAGLLYFLFQRELQKRQRAEDELKRQNERFQKIFDHMPVMIAFLDENGKPALVNRFWEQTIGWTLDEAQKINLLAEIYPDPEQYQVAMQTIAESDGEWHDFRSRIKTGREIDTSWAQIRLSDGTRIGIGQVIAERKQAEHLVVELEKEKQAREMRNRFTSMVAHEFRTPLTVIQSSLDIVDRYHDRLKPEQKQFHFDKARRCINLLVEMTEQMLTINRVGSGRVQFSPSVINLETFCHQLVDALQVGASKQQEICLMMQGKLEAVTLDAECLTHVLSNLLSNALKYSPENSKVYLDVQARENDLVFQVRDEGIGIPPEALERLFEPFYRAKNVGLVPGTGLGLPIVKDYVELQGGSIICDTEVGRGTTFTVMLPLR